MSPGKYDLWGTDKKQSPMMFVFSVRFCVFSRARERALLFIYFVLHGEDERARASCVVYIQPFYYRYTERMQREREIISRTPPPRAINYIYVCIYMRYNYILYIYRPTSQQTLRPPSLETSIHSCMCARERDERESLSPPLVSLSLSLFWGYIISVYIYSFALAFFLSSSS